MTNNTLLLAATAVHSQTRSLFRLTRVVIALDFRGHGKSARVAGDYRFQSYTQDVSNFVQSKFDNAVILWGQSLGANIAIQVTATEPEIVNALVLEEPAVDFSEADSVKPFLQITRNLAASGHSYENIKGELENVPVTIPGQDEPVRLVELRGEAYITLTAKCVHALDPEVMDFLIDGRAYEGYNVEEFFRQVGCPTQFLQGNPSLMEMTDEVAKHGVSLIPNCKHVYVENAGHNLHLKCPHSLFMPRKLRVSNPSVSYSSHKACASLKCASRRSFATLSCAREN